MKTYVITLSKQFPTGHIKAGQETFFKEQLERALKGYDCHVIEHPDGLTTVINGRKLHTIRANFPLWSERISQVQRGEAVLSVRQWTGKPYRSKQREIARLTASDGVGIQRLDLNDLNQSATVVEGNRVELISLSKNDGLTFEDWHEWFKDYDLSAPLAIIHFTRFRY